MKPTRSTKTTETTFRSSALGRGSSSPSAAPQEVQKASSGETTVPQEGHDRPSALPQFPQKSAPAGLAKPQAAHEEADMAWLV